MEKFLRHVRTLHARARQGLGWLLLTAVFLIGCQQQDLAASADLLSTPTPQPTPTLASGAPQPAPPTPPLATAVVDTAVPLPTLTAPAPPTATPLPQERVEIGQDALAQGDFSAAAAHFDAGLLSTVLDETEQLDALFGLGVAQLAERQYEAAATAFNDLLALTDAAPFSTYFRLGQALTGAGDLTGAMEAYQTFLAANPETAAYVAPLIADLYFALDDRANGVAALETAVAADAHRITAVNNRFRLAELLLADGRVDDAIAQYDAIIAVAQTEFTRGQATYLAGQAELNRGANEAAFARFQTGISQYPGAYESYLGLVQLVEAGVPVDEFQRGLVNYHAQSYEPCVAAFDRYLAGVADTPRAEALLFSAYCYEGVGNVEAALAQLDRYAAALPVQAQWERAELLRRVGNTSAALDAYQSLLDTYPTADAAPDAAWQGALLARSAGDPERAIALLRRLGGDYPTADRAAEALFDAGWLAYQQGDVETAVTLWRQSASGYPGREFGAASLLWLLRTLPTHTTPTVAATATASADAAVTPLATAQISPTATITTTTELTPTQPTPAPDPLALRAEMEALAETFAPRIDYYGLRVYHVVNGERPFTSPLAFNPTASETAARAAVTDANAWLQDQLGLAPGTAVADLDPQLAADPRLRLGEKLWQMGLLEAAKLELEPVRAAASDDALRSYQLALYFRDLGLYRSSILAAETAMRLTGVNVFTAPRALAQLAYPTYYADLMLPLAEQYGYDPRVQFALVRQESLFESFARSGAAANGLSQVIPDTGAYIAQQLGWPDYELEDLYKPHVGLNFGAFYLAQQLDTFDGNVHAALAAYNAGPGNAARWHAVAGDDLDLYLETVNFWETRLYIERIYVGYAIYEMLYGE